MLALLLCIHTGSYAQKKGNKDKEKEEKTEKKDSVDNKEKNKLKKYEDVIKKEMQSQKGFLTTVYDKKEDKYFFEIPKTIYGKDILVVNRISKASADMRNGSFGLVGDEIGQAVYRFEEGPRNKLFLRRISFTEYQPDTTAAMYKGIQMNNVQAIAKAFDVSAINKDSTAVVVDVTEFLNSDSDVLYFANQKLKERAGMGGQQNDRSYVKFVHAYDTNLEVRAVKTYDKGLNPTWNNYTIELNSSFVLLPEEPMRPRLADRRVGYFAVGHRDFDVNPQGVEPRFYVKRWRLEPKPGEEQKYLDGELVEPQKPIVFYIDPATPKKWVPYLIKGVNDWQKAFEKVGFKNAIYAREAPSKEEDSTWSLDNAKYSAIIYRPSEIANAMGPSTSDPRSGEIIESHIFWYHNVMKTLRYWYMVQAGAIDERARKPVFDDELMGDLIRFVSSHEVGHALGLMHNFGASHATPVEKLRDKEWLTKHGHTASIMDYARFNYVAQPEDGIGKEGIYPRINDYDEWALSWGYRWLPQYKDEYEEEKALIQVVTDSVANNRRLWFGSEVEYQDPRSQNEDLGDDAMLAGEYGIKNLKRIVPELLKWNTQPHKSFEETQEAYGALLGQFGMYMGHALKNIGGVYHEVRIGATVGPQYEPVPYDKQKRAMAFISKELFKTPEWLNETTVYDKILYSFGIEIGKVQRNIIDGIIRRSRMSTLLNSEYESDIKAYTLTEMLDDMDKAILTELYEKENIDFYRRNLQKIYVNRLLQQTTMEDKPGLITGPYEYPYYLSDMQTLLRRHLIEQKTLFEKAARRSGINEETKIHLKDIAAKISRLLDLED